MKSQCLKRQRLKRQRLKRQRLKRQRLKRAGLAYAVNDVPQPHVPVAFGLLNAKPEPMSDS